VIQKCSAVVATSETAELLPPGRREITMSWPIRAVRRIRFTPFSIAGLAGNQFFVRILTLIEFFH
jgi:hypothetical protein